MIKKIIGSLIIVFLLLVLVTGCKDKKDNVEHVDTKPDSSIVKGTTIEGLKIGQLSIVYQNKISRLVANVQNTNPNDYTLRVISVKLYNKEDELLIDTTGYIGTTIKTNETKQLIIEVTDDLKSATRVEYSIIK